MRALVLTLLLVFSSLSAHTVHILTITESVDLRIAEDAKSDLEGFEKLVQQIQDKTDYETNLIAIKTSNISAEGVLQLIEEIDTSADDILMVAFSGHGALFKTENSMPNLLFLSDQSSLSIESLIYYTSTQPARYKLVLIDACQNYVPLHIEYMYRKKAKKMLIGSAKSKKIAQEQDPLQILLDRSEGFDLLTSCSPTEKSYSTVKGSFFTTEWLCSLNQVTLTSSWQAIFDEASTRVIKKLSDLDREQHPQYLHADNIDQLLTGFTTRYESIHP